MWKPLNEKIKSEWPAIRVMLLQLALPAVISSVYASLVWSRTAPRPGLLKALNLFFVGLFFCMWFVSIYERAKKRTSDSSSFKALSGGIEDLKSLLGKISETQAALPKPVPSGTKSSAIKLIDEARTILKTGYPLASMLQAGVAFEHAIRNFARKLRMPYLEGMPLLKVINKIEPTFLRHGLVRSICFEKFETKWSTFQKKIWHRLRIKNQSSIYTLRLLRQSRATISTGR